ncbi:MAG: ATP-grasp domain-containing protein [Lachnospiraceae bacterium]|nr:ATP-grasp domain-containing protein [Lachnospiraceae bacterium]
MERLDGKKILIISSDSSDVSLVEAAKSLGVYAICCDRYTDHRISPAKALADEAWDMDYSDVDAVAEQCRKKGVNGVIAGYSEERVLAACRISNKIGTPFYATEEQINLTRNKREFKELCKRNGVRVPNNYYADDLLQGEVCSDVHFPVIVKPVDNGGRKGITICRSMGELESAIQIALDNSKAGDVVIEDYIEGMELCAVYTIVDGEISLSCLNDKYISKENEDAAKLCAFVVTPSKYYDEYLSEVDEKIKALLRAVNAQNGVANFQFIANEAGIWAFEMGYRINGNDDFKVIRKYNGIDFLKMLVIHSLTGRMGEKLDKDNPCFPEYCATLVLYLCGGIIGRIDYSEIENMESIDDISINRCVGNEIIANGTNGQKAGMIKFSATSMKNIMSMVTKIKNGLKVEDIEGKDMILTMFDESRLKMF